MKYIVVLIDGAADEPNEALNNKTPLMVAKMPFLEKLTKKAQVGMVQTVPEGMSPGSDVANLSIMGYAPEKYHTGRSPLEALSAGVELKEDDVAIRLNLVTLSDDEPFNEKSMIDYSGGEISTEESSLLIKDLKKHFENGPYHIYEGISYRHVFLWEKGSLDVTLVPPHNILDQKISDHLPKGDNASYFNELIKASYEFLKDHPINKKRIEDGKNPANAIWLWGEGKKPLLDKFFDKNNLKGAVISAVDLIKGIGLGAEMEIIEVPGATGTIETNFEGKGVAGLENILDKVNYIYIHLEAPDECGHQGDVEGKVKSLELIDHWIIQPLVEGLENHHEDFRLLVVPDHATPLAKRTHTMDAVPYMLYDSRVNLGGALHYDEVQGKKGPFLESGPELHNLLIEKNQ